MSKQEIKQAIQNAVQAIPHGQSIRKIRLFGSYLHGDATPSSDIDLIMDFDESGHIGLFALGDIEDALRNLLKRQVDIVTSKGLKKYMRDKVLNEAETLYERKG
jgi:predicted nucleotidyltransferase